MRRRGDTTQPRLLVLPSPLLGPTAYGPLADALGRLGQESAVALLPGEPFTPAEVLSGFVAEARRFEATILLAHSNAGFYAPAVAEAVAADRVVYADAALAPVDATSTRLVPERLLDEVRRLAGPGGVLPPWSDWWPRREVVRLFPSPEWLDRVRAGEPRLSLDYVGGELAVPPGWTARPSGYLAFGATYAAELAQARASGWPVAELDGTHLQHLWEPDLVAAEVIRLLGLLGPPAVS